MKKLIGLWIILSAIQSLYAQSTEKDSLKNLLAVTKEDSSRVLIMEGLSFAYQYAYPDSALAYALEGLQLSKKINFPKGEAYCLNAIGNVYYNIGDYVKALEMYVQALKIRERLNDPRTIAVTYSNIGSVYSEQGDHKQALYYILKTKQLDEKIKDSLGLIIDLFNIGSIYQSLKNNDSALYYEQKAYQIALIKKDSNYIGAIMNTFASIQVSLNNLPLAIKYYSESIFYSKLIEDSQVLSDAFYGLAKIFEQKGLLDSSFLYSRKALSIAQKADFLKQTLRASMLLSDLFKKLHRFDSAFHYQELSIMIKDSLYNIEKVKRVQNLGFIEQQRQLSIQAARQEYWNRIKLYVLLSAVGVFLLIAVILWYNNRQKQKANQILNKRNEQIETQRNSLEKTLITLKSTQAMLIQSEKMASLGELTAGIAHEIQNPLNFVNNFSEVNKELVDELQDELKSGNTEEAIAISNDIKDNEEKINQHGRRADAIVKGMLQHSRSSTGVKEPTDINELAAEYLRLSYHGLRTKDKSFNATLKYDYDESAGNINIIPQDIGRILLNLYNNAFYAVSEKKRQRGEHYEPIVSVSTKKINDKVEIRVKDNGNGISQKVLDKIFQPFFTTKPTGHGTGLGLSLSYDIVKAHGGEIKVNTNEGEGAEFIIELPDK